MTLTPILRATLAAYEDGATTSRDVAARLGISVSAAGERLMRLRRLHLIPQPLQARDSIVAAIAEGLDPRGPTLRTVSLSAISRGRWRLLTEPTLVVHDGVVVAEWVPANAPVISAPPVATEDDNDDAEPIRLELARLALEVAEAKAEVEGLSDLVYPTHRVRRSRRQQELGRRRARYAALRKGPPSD